eukprot:m.78975 g.78975  ORF g.78975 m.78975 type:complete len:409 (-) comp12698_c0_seq1:25-1251(-)
MAKSLHVDVVEQGISLALGATEGNNLVMSAPKIFSGSSNRPLAEKVAALLDTSLAEASTFGESQVTKFANKEINAKILSSVREHDVFIVQSGFGDCSVNDGVMELMIMANALKIASARRVTAVLPYLPYSKQSKQKRRGAIPAKLIADLLKVAGVSQVVCVDLHYMQMQGFFDMPMDNIKVTPIVTSYLRENLEDYKSFVVVAKNAGGSKRAALLAKRLQLDFAMIFGEQTKYAECLSEETLLYEDGSQQASYLELEDSDVSREPPALDGRRLSSEQMPPDILGGDDDESTGTCVIGEIDKRPVIIADDMINGPEPFVKAAKLLRKEGATKVVILATHGLFAGDAAKVFQESEHIDKIFVTNSIPQEKSQSICSKIHVIDLSLIIAETIRRLHNDESLASLYGAKPKF